MYTYLASCLIALPKAAELDQRGTQGPKANVSLPTDKMAWQVHAKKISLYSFHFMII